MADTTTTTRPILLLEINEVPWRIVDKARGDGAFPAVRRFFGAAETYTTISRDVGELSPWITWPSLHRGMSNTEHGIRYLGQDVATFRGTPIWEDYRARGLSVGVCGSLQSWPPRDPGPGGFFIPDTFAHDARCVPSYLEPLQQFNLDQVRRNGRVVRGGSVASARKLLGVLPALARARVRPRTVRRIAEQLVGERRDRTRVARRPVFQTLLFWDVFKSLYRPEAPPALATFFTNHVASAMHRYWDDVFPEDFPERAPAAPRPHAATMRFALEVLDDILADALALQARCPELLVVFASSMGQAAVHNDHEGFDAAVADLAKLMAACDVPAEGYAPLLAMVPQVAVRIDDAGLRARTRAGLERARYASGAVVFEVDESGATLSVTIKTPRRADKDRGGFFRHDGAGEPRFVPFDLAGVVMHDVEAGTAYHVPEGVLALAGAGVAARDARTPIEATAVKSMLLDLGGVAAAAASTAGGATAARGASSAPVAAE